MVDHYNLLHAKIRNKNHERTDVEVSHYCTLCLATLLPDQEPTKLQMTNLPLHFMNKHTDLVYAICYEMHKLNMWTMTNLQNCYHLFILREENNERAPLVVHT